MTRAWLLVLWGALALTPAPAEPAEARGPRLAVEPSSFDFGEALPGRTLRKEFRLRNVGAQDLLIESVKTSCGCTAALVSEKEKRVKPGDSATLKVEMHTTASAGPMHKTVLIRSNDPEQGLFKLELSASVVDRR